MCIRDSRGEIERLFVMGCLSERYKEELRPEIPEVDDYFGVRDMADVVAAVGGQWREHLAGERMLTTPRHYAYLKISEGCDRRCGYCAIPLIRGRHVSVPMDALVAEAEKLAAGGTRELIVIAQDTTYYGLDLYGERKLGELLRRLCRIDGIEWVRLHYAYPASFPQDAIDAVSYTHLQIRQLRHPDDSRQLHVLHIERAALAAALGLHELQHQISVRDEHADAILEPRIVRYLDRTTVRTDQRHVVHAAGHDSREFRHVDFFRHRRCGRGLHKQAERREQKPFSHRIVF